MKTDMIAKPLLAAWWLALSCSGLAANLPQLAVFANGEYSADVVLPEKAGGVEKFAAEELAYHFRKAFGKDPEIIGEEKLDAARHPFHIYLGATKAAVAAGLPVGRLADEEHVVKTVGNGLYLLGGDGDTAYDEVFRYNDVGDSWEVAMRGTLYAAYDFLENEMGVKWLWPGETGEVVPKRTEFGVGAIDRRAQEPLASRFFHGRKCKVKTGFTSDEAAEAFYLGQRKFLLRQRHGTRRRFLANHSFAQWWKNYGNEHPEYFNLLPNGRRMPHRAPELCTMCVSEPGVWRRRVDEWRRWWAKASTGRHPPYPWVNCCDNDGTALCTCPRCRSWDGPDPRFAKSDYWNGNVAKDFDEKYLGRKLTDLGLSNGSRWTIPREKWSDGSKAASVSDRYVRFYNEVAALAKRYCPEAKAVGYAYANYIDPPLRTRVGPDTVIVFVPRSYFPYDADESANFRRQWGGWHKMGAERMVLRPNYMLACGNHPVDTARRIVDDFAFAYTNGMSACQQDSITGAWSAQAMHLYALSRMMRDPLRGYEKAREDVLAGFGAAADAVNGYFDMVEAHSAGWTCDSYQEIGLKNVTGGLNDVGGGFRNPNAVLGDFFDERFFAKGYSLLDEGVRAAVGDAEVIARIEYLRKGLRDTELGRLCRIAQKASEAAPRDAAKKAAYDAAFKALVAYRESVEGDFVCDYARHADWERMFIGWPHKVRSAKKAPPATEKPAGKSKPADCRFDERRGRWLEKAEAAKPRLFVRTVAPIRLVDVVADPAVFQGWRVKEGKPIGDVFSKPLAHGDTFIVDFGEHLVGTVSLSLMDFGRAVDAPVRLRFSFAEVPLELAEDAEATKPSVSKAWYQRETMTFDDVPATVRLPRRYAFRYVKVEVVGCSPYGRFGISGASAEAVTSADVSALKPFRPSSPLAARIDEIACRTLRDCMQTVFEDGPKRDRRLWLGDLRLEALANYETYRNFDVVKRSLYLLAGTCADDGLLNSDAYERPVPRRGECRILDYTALFAATLLEYAEASGDFDTAKDLWPLCVAQIGALLETVGADGVFRDDGKWWCFIDWHDGLNRQTAEQGALVYGFKATLRLAERLGRQNDVAFLPGAVARMERAARSVLWDETRGLFVCEKDRQASYVGQAWLVLAGVVDDDMARRCLRAVLSDAEAVKPVTPYANHYFTEALHAAGLRDEAERHLLACWGEMAKLGADTFWEVFVPDDHRAGPYRTPLMNSYCHAWSCAPAYFLRNEKFKDGSK